MCHTWGDYMYNLSVRGVVFSTVALSSSCTGSVYCTFSDSLSVKLHSLVHRHVVSTIVSAI